MLLLAASNRQPVWLEEGFREYARRLRGRSALELKQIPLARRSSSTSPQRAAEEEGRRLLAAVPEGAHVVALTEQGSLWSTRELALRLEHWLGLGAPTCFLIGGPDGLSAACLARAQERWSLSPLTLPHGLARLFAAEALYRAATLLARHPYHRD